MEKLKEYFKNNPDAIIKHVEKVRGTKQKPGSRAEP